MEQRETAAWEAGASEAEATGAGAAVEAARPAPATSRLRRARARALPPSCGRDSCTERVHPCPLF